MNSFLITNCIFILVYHINKCSNERLNVSEKPTNASNYYSGNNNIYGDSDKLGRWTYSIVCSDGRATQLNIVETPLMFVNTLHHHALEFKVLCKDNRLTYYTVDFSARDFMEATASPFTGVLSFVTRRFGRYQNSENIKNNLKINSSIEEINSITFTTKRYILLKYNCQDYAIEMYNKIEEKAIDFGTKCKEENFSSLVEPNGAMFHCFNNYNSKENCTENMKYLYVKLKNPNNESLDTIHTEICEQITQAKDCSLEVMSKLMANNSEWNGRECSAIKKEYIAFQECSAEWYLQLFGCSKKSYATSLRYEFRILNVSLITLIMHIMNS